MGYIQQGTIRLHLDDVAVAHLETAIAHLVSSGTTFFLTSRADEGQLTVQVGPHLPLSVVRGEVADEDLDHAVIDALEDCVHRTGFMIAGLAAMNTSQVAAVYESLAKREADDSRD